MPKVVADITMSLDGFVTGPNAGPKAGLGEGGDPLHTWVMEPQPLDEEILASSTEESGAVVMGRNLFDVIDGPDGWNDDMGYGAGHAATPPFFVVTHSPPDTVRLGLDFTFVTEGVAAAIEQASAACGDKNVYVMGGGDVIRQTIDAGLADELRIHLAPIILGGGTPLFADGTYRQLVQTAVRPSKDATHLTYSLR